MLSKIFSYLSGATTN